MPISRFSGAPESHEPHRPRYSQAMGPQSGSAVLERRETGAPIRVDTRAPGQARRGRRRSLTLLALTAVLPGSAQLAAGNRRLGRFALRVWLAMWGAAALVALLALVSRSAALTVLTHRWTLLVVQVVLLAWAVLWAVLFVDAWRLGQPARLPRRDRRGAAGAAACCCSCCPAAAAYAGSNVGAARGAMTSVFASGQAAGAVDGRYNILLLGGDSGAGRVGLRPDSIQLASVDAESGRAVLFGFSRETENIRFRPGSVMAGLMPEGWTCGDECLLNALYTWGTDHRKEFPAGTKDPGLLATTEAVEALTGPRHPVLRARRPQGLPQPGRRGRRARHRRAAAHADRLAARDQGLDRGRQPAPRRLPRPLVRPQPRQLHELRADGAPALRHHLDGQPARPADGRAALRRHRQGHQGCVPHRHPAGGPRQPGDARGEDQDSRRSPRSTSCPRSSAPRTTTRRSCSTPSRGRSRRPRRPTSSDAEPPPPGPRRRPARPRRASPRSRR